MLGLCVRPKMGDKFLCYCTSMCPSLFQALMPCFPTFLLFSTSSNLTDYDTFYFRCATQLSANDLVVGRVRSAASDPTTLGTVRRLAIDKSQ